MPGGDGVDAHPRPTRPGGPRVVVGGGSPAAYRRAVRYAHGFFTVGGPERVGETMAGLRRAAEEVERPARLGELEVVAMPIPPPDRAGAEAFRELGVADLLIYPLPLEDPDDMARVLEEHASLLD